MMDTSAYLGLAEGREDAIACQNSIATYGIPRYVTSIVIAETHNRMLFDHGREAARQFLADIAAQPGTVVRPTQDDDVKAVQIIDKYSDLALTLCDALTIAVMFRMGVLRAFTYDRNHFLPLGIIVVPPFDI